MSLKTQFENGVEEFREKLVRLFGDHHTVHSTVDDAKAAITTAHPEAAVEEVTDAAKEVPVASTVGTTEGTVGNSAITGVQMDKAIDDAIAAAPTEKPAPTE